MAMNTRRLLSRILRGEMANVSFVDLIQLVEELGFREIGGRGSHRVFTRADVTELVNLQVEKGDAKLYQVRQIVRLIRRYNLKLEED
jgi:predicted RNA binding protein YcfA (HicA-like mRNA interferase family)